MSFKTFCYAGREPSDHIRAARDARPHGAPRPVVDPDGVEAEATLVGKVVPEYLLARVRCGHEFQDASRRQVLLVDPHAKG